MMKFTKYKLIGLLCMLSFWLMGINEHNKSELTHILLMIFIVLAVILLDYFLLTKLMLPDGKSWCLALPFAIIAIVANYVFSWNCVLPFFMLSVMFVCAQIAKNIVKTKEKPIKNILILSANACICIGLFSFSLFCFGVHI